MYFLTMPISFHRTATLICFLFCFECRAKSVVTTHKVHVSVSYYVSKSTKANNYNKKRIITKYPLSIKRNKELQII